MSSLRKCGLSAAKAKTMLANKSDMRTYQKQAEIFLESLGKSPEVVAQPTKAPAFESLFGKIERSRENIDRIHAITHAAASAPGAYDDKPNYNPEAV